VYALTKCEITDLKLYNDLLPYVKRYIDDIRSRELSLFIWSLCKLIAANPNRGKNDININSILNVLVKRACVITPKLVRKDAFLI